MRPRGERRCTRARSLTAALFVWALLGPATSGSGEEVALSGVDRSISLHEVILPRLADPSLQSLLGSTTPQVTLGSSAEDKTVTARLGVHVRDFLLDLKLSGPISGGSKDVRLADLDGLRGSTTADFGVSWIRWHPRANPLRQQRICDAYTKDWPAEAAKKFDCSYLGFPAGSEFRHRYASAIDWGIPLVLDARFRVGKKSFDYVELPDLVSSRVSHVNYSTSASFGVLTRVVGLVAVHFRYENAFRAAGSSQICSPLESTSSLRCEDLVLGAPRRHVARVAQAEIRRFFGSRFGVNPRVGYEIRRSTTALELPIYFLRDREHGLNGGISLGWRSDTEQFGMSIFVGEALQLAP
jgi:hypothetical protein